MGYDISRVAPNRSRPCGHDIDCWLGLRTGFAGQKFSQPLASPPVIRVFDEAGNVIETHTSTRASSRSRKVRDRLVGSLSRESVEQFQEAHGGFASKQRVKVITVFGTLLCC
jgi:hypothetical protein